VSGRHAAPAAAAGGALADASTTSGGWVAPHPGRHARPRLRSAQRAVMDRARAARSRVPAWLWLVPTVTALLAVAGGAAAIALHEAAAGDWLSVSTAAFTSGGIAGAAAAVWMRVYPAGGR
jgi:hypothetical protein